jgi:hypothetical protein
MDKFMNGKKLALLIGVLGALAASSVAYSRDSGKPLKLSNRPKAIVIDNLDTAVFTKGDPATAAVAQEICGDCHSSDYPTTQPKLNCAGWGKEIVKMGNTFNASVAWNEDGVKKETLYQILAYLTDNYGSDGSDKCTGHELDSIPLNQ